MQKVSISLGGFGLSVTLGTLYGQIFLHEDALSSIAALLIGISFQIAAIWITLLSRQGRES